MDTHEIEPGHRDQPLAAAPEKVTLQLREEELFAEKRLVQLGVVRIRRRVITERRTIDVAVRREEVTVERLTVDESGVSEPRAAAQVEPALAERLRALQLGETLRLPIVEEEVVVQKRPMVTRELVIDKRLVEEVQKLSDTVRREEARITHNVEPRPAASDRVQAISGVSGATTPQAESTPGREEQAPRVAHDAGSTLALSEEELQVRKQVVDAGTVQVRTGVVSELRTVVVGVEHEETAVEQVPVEPRLAERQIVAGEEIFDIPEYAERVSLGKKPVVTEEITVGKEPVQDVRHVTATVRREVAHIERQGDARVAGTERSEEVDG